MAHGLCAWDNQWMEDDAFRCGEPVRAVGRGHLDECRAIPLIAKGEREPTTYISDCEYRCPHVRAAIKRGQELAQLHGWP